ncbi:hypothetical protein SAMN04488021_1518 [Paracoccus aminovorans]|uniref:Uncharacterized protein n=1 Tax=Paracoccus aminovorans TaxID=34004 RepID=A0A1I3EN62_9RHOB|nr:hypothetical protein [Paracoccus aminovorans]PKP68336.1 MAG: hypothetical protein CVT83_05600 [Alphaproteobacteria bacterium HGW-Alphaproteobacteria-5]CQR87005.1 hypothetical protein JCM7685_2454 [Paracoccus aminovorans]SFI00389.1 hypothetical protein SAMN04488021_1518 [Paracoccus aminovorans]
MYPRGYYFYAMQQQNKAKVGRTDGEVKVATPSDEPMADVGMFLRLGVVMALVIAAVATLTSLAG